MLDAAVDLRDVQITARHADPRTTMRYDRARKNLNRRPKLHSRRLHGVRDLTGIAPHHDTADERIVLPTPGPQERQEMLGERLGDERIGDVLLALEHDDAASGRTVATASMAGLDGSGLFSPVSSRTGTVILAAFSGSSRAVISPRISRVTVCAAATRPGQEGAARKAAMSSSDISCT
jgi:hypothetical protein